MGDVVSLVEKAAETIEKEKAEKLVKKLEKGTYDLEDLAEQFRQMRRMGGMSGVLALLPGVQKVKKQLSESQIDDSILKRQEATDAELDALAQTAPPGAGGVTFIPALGGALTPQWRGHARGTLHGLTAAHERSHIARAVLEGLACSCRDVVQRLAALGLAGREVVVLGGGGRSALWMQIRADLMTLPHRIASRTDTCAVGAALLALVAVGAQPDVATAAASLPQTGTLVVPAGALDDVYDRYRRLVTAVAPLGDQPWA